MFMKVMVVALVVTGISMPFLSHEVVWGLSAAGLLIGTAGLFATQLWKTLKLWVLTTAVYLLPIMGAPFAINDKWDLLGVEAMLGALLFGTLFLFYRKIRLR